MPTATDVERFVREGWLRVDDAFPRAVADACRELLWREIGADPGDRATWPSPSVRLGMRTDPPFREAVKGPRLAAAIDALVGPGRWSPYIGMGTFVVRFPVPGDPGDTGWHVDASFPGDAPDDYLRWRVNVASRGRALLALFLFSDVGDDDAPTRIRSGSHLDVARLLAPHGEQGLSFMEVADRLDATAARPIATATGAAGTVYLCHPFLAHAAQAHAGTVPRFLAQPPIVPVDPIRLDRPEAERSAVERAIHLGL